jgi:tRNA pseudouridine38-40 synthase
MNKETRSTQDDSDRLEASSANEPVDESVENNVIDAGDTEIASLTSASSTPSRAPYRRCAPGHFRTRLHVSYDGTDFSGWQRQTSLTSVQGTLEEAIQRIFGKHTDGRRIPVIGASRTDAGVHAHQQVAHFDSPRDPSTFDLRYAVQCLTPKTVVVTDIFHAPDDFHAIACVTHKTYKYRVHNRRVPSALDHRYSYWIRHPLDLDFLNEASQFVVGKQDFKSFQSTGTEVSTTVRTILEARWDRIEENTLEFTIKGDGFLKQMVRNIVGTVIQLNRDSRPATQVKSIIDALDRRRAGPTAEPQGLFLCSVTYPEFIDKKCRKL